MVSSTVSLSSSSNSSTVPHRHITTVVPSNQMNDFFLRPLKSPFKKLFTGTILGEVVKAMSFNKPVPKGLKLSECERGIGGKNSPIRYIPELDPVQEALEKKKKVTYFKLMLTSM